MGSQHWFLCVINQMYEYRQEHKIRLTKWYMYSQLKTKNDSTFCKCMLNGLPHCRLQAKWQYLLGTHAVLRNKTFKIQVYLKYYKNRACHYDKTMTQCPPPPFFFFFACSLYFWSIWFFFSTLTWLLSTTANLSNQQWAYHYY